MAVIFVVALAFIVEPVCISTSISKAYGDDIEIIVASSQDKCQGDFNQDGNIDGSDLSIFADNYGRNDCTQVVTCQDDDEANQLYHICNYWPLTPGNLWIYSS